MLEAGLASSPWQHMDDTGTGVDGEKQPSLTCCATGAHGCSASMRKLWICCAGWACRSGLRTQWDSCRSSRTGAGRSCSEGWRNRSGSERGDAPPDDGGAALAAYPAESGHVRLLVCDDADSSSGWPTNWPYAGFHDGRHYQSLTPCVPQHR